MLKASSSARGRSRAVCSAASMVSYLRMSGTQVSSEQEDMRDHGAYWSAQGAHILSAVAGVSLYVMLKFSASASRNHKLVCDKARAQTQHAQPNGKTNPEAMPIARARTGVPRKR